MSYPIRPNVLSLNMYHQEFESPTALRDTIKCFWYTRWDFDEQLSSFEVIPDGYAEIIFHFGSSCSVSVNGNLQPLPSPFMMGLLNQPVVFFTTNRLEVVGIRCYPWTVFDLLGLQPGKDGLRVFEHPIAGIQPSLEKLMEAGKVNEAVAIIKEYFLGALVPVAANPILHKAGTAMRKAQGTLPVTGVAAAAHATVRTLERNFKQAAGYTVKDVSGLMRFEQVRNHLWHHPDTSLTGLAHDLGYTDQAHLSREFKRYSGTTPAAFARKAKQGKQVFSGDLVRFIQG